MKYTDYMMLVVEYSNAKHDFLTERNSGRYNIRKEGKLKRRMEEIYERLCTEASKAFPGGAEYDKDKPTVSKKENRTPLPKVVKSNPPKVYTADGRKREWKAVGKNAVLFVDGVESGYSEPFGSHRAAVEGAERLQEEDAE